MNSLCFLTSSFHGKEDDTITIPRHAKFMKKSITTSFDPASLPPAEVAPSYHVFRDH